MAQQRTKSGITWESGATPDGSSSHAAEPNAAEFRELARQRRFVRESDASATEAPGAPQPRSTSVTLRAQADAPARTVAASSATGPDPRFDEAGVIAVELSRTTDKLVAARESLARETQRADNAEQSLRSANDRLMAANVLVQDAQRATHQSAERCAWLEGRNDALQEALELAVNASTITRWRWRRELAKAKRAGGTGTGRS